MNIKWIRAGKAMVILRRKEKYIRSFIIKKIKSEETKNINESDNTKK